MLVITYKNGGVRLGPRTLYSVPYVGIVRGELRVVKGCVQGVTRLKGDAGEGNDRGGFSYYSTSMYY